ncbi:MAG: S9 family peptidase [Tannerella sp.]|jgi:dipeptidyl aminopeptidase/acylaminoacyl peptidase|nr:S9 family peptidase [Tannerella sp.]
MRRINFLSVLIISCLFASAQSPVKVTAYRTSSFIPVFSPVTIDSTDVEKKKFSEKELLKTEVDFGELLQNQAIIEADTAGVIDLSFDADGSDAVHKNAIRLLAFNIDADRYCKANLTVTSTDMLEIYVNDKLEKTKDTREDSLSKAKATSISLTLEPRRYQIVIKQLSGAGKSAESSLKAEVTASKTDSAALISVSTDRLRRITINDILEGSRLTANSSISPSGKYLICATSVANPGGNAGGGPGGSPGGSYELELRTVADNKVVYRFPPSISPLWIMDRDYVVYTRQGTKRRNLYRMDVATLEEKLLAENIQSDRFVLSPDNKFLIFNKSEEIPADKGDLKRVLAPNDRSGAYRRRNSLYLYDFDTKATQRLTFGHTSVSLNDISPDGKKALIATNSDNITQRPFSIKTLYELDLTTLKVDTLFTDPFIGGAQYSPDAKQLLITGSGEAFNGIALNIKDGQISNTYDYQAFLVDRKTLAVTPVTKDFNPSINGAQWSKYDNMIYFTTEDKDRISIYCFNPKNSTFRKLDLPEDMIRSFRLAEQAPIAVYQGESATNSYRLYSYNIKTGKSTLLSDPFKSQLDEMELSKVTDWNFVSADGTTIEGRYYLPYGYEEGKKYPMIVYYYGGTSPTARVLESTYPLQVYAALGYVVYTLQPSGTTGFGQEFAARHVNAWGKKTADEIILGTQLFWREHDFVDSAKIGCIGASYGGFMTQYLQTRTDIFAAAVSHAGISNITSYWGEGYWGYSYSSAASAFSYPWNNPQLYHEQSPLFHADKINTPLLLLHGTADTNVPIGESIQMYNALKILGKTVEFITVDKENHGILEYKKRIEWNKTIYAWFARWLKSQPEWWNELYPER